MGYSNLVTHPITNAIEQSLTFLSELNLFLSLWYSDYAERIFFFLNFLDEKWYQKEKKNISYCMAGKVENKKNQRSMKMRTITCFSDRTSGTLPWSVERR